ncbi:MAG TPA: hypothetical protein VMW45_04540 [Dehalococcoidia bacterium]|nr:hypothetical protein [Dehalococcoidia bacterium]
MRIVCSRCGKEIKDIAPQLPGEEWIRFYNRVMNSATHGLCPECYEKETGKKLKENNGKATKANG